MDEVVSLLAFRKRCCPLQQRCRKDRKPFFKAFRRGRSASFLWHGNPSCAESALSAAMTSLALRRLKRVEDGLDGPGLERIRPVAIQALKRARRFATGLQFESLWTTAARTNRPLRVRHSTERAGAQNSQSPATTTDGTVIWNAKPVPYSWRTKYRDRLQIRRPTRPKAGSELQHTRPFNDARTPPAAK
jgi:hypothetical protein